MDKIEDMPNNYFKFKQFTIYQDGSAMKVGTDGVLLGAWANMTGAKRVLDIGTGTGLIAIMLAQRTTNDVLVDAVEIDASAYQQAVDNFGNCPWNSRMNAINASFQEFCADNTEVYDCIVSNPPYFMNGLNAKGDARTQARKADSLPFEDLLQGSRKLLSQYGRLSVILPIEEGEYFERLARLEGFSLSRKISVLPNPGKPAKRYLLEFTMQDATPEYAELTVENGQRHVYSQQYIDLTKEFYLKF
jgi:tRNA1Val (adenine37-N6)-methyltransferase